MQDGSVLSAGNRTTSWHGTVFPRPWRLIESRVEPFLDEFEVSPAPREYLAAPIADTGTVNPKR